MTAPERRDQCMGCIDGVALTVTLDDDGNELRLCNDCMTDLEHERAQSDDTAEQHATGRPPKHGKAMSAAERKAAERKRVRTLADRRYYEQWDERVCLHVLGTGKYSDADQREAWRRLGQLKEWI